MFVRLQVDDYQMEEIMRQPIKELRLVKKNNIPAPPPPPKKRFFLLKVFTFKIQKTVIKRILRKKTASLNGDMEENKPYRCF